MTEIMISNSVKMEEFLHIQKSVLDCLWKNSQEALKANGLGPPGPIKIIRSSLDLPYPNNHRELQDGQQMVYEDKTT